jgi:hypothetical protein
MLSCDGTLAILNPYTDVILDRAVIAWPTCMPALLRLQALKQLGLLYNWAILTVGVRKGVEGP